MSAKLQKLLFAIGMQDNASAGVARLQARITRLTATAQRSFQGIGTSALAVFGAGYSLHKLIEPAMELNRSLGELASLGVEADGLQVMQKAAGRFAFAYGGAAEDVIRASYDIQSAIAGLTAHELASFTTAGGVLARATKADVGTISKYLGTMYGIYEEQAAKMGKAAWVDQLAGRTAYAIQIFKTSGDNMSAAFTSLGANAQSAGIDAAEQMAVLGMLQATMSGAEAGTQYKAFLRGVGKAQQELGLSFTDSQGRMLGMVEILDKLRGKYGDELTVAQADEMKKAFGSDQAASLIKLMLKQSGKLRANIRDLSGIKDMQHAERMAKRQTDAFMRLGGASRYVWANFVQKVTPAIERWTDRAVDKLEVLNKWITRYPNLTRVLGYCAVAVVALGGAVALASLAFYLFKLVSLGLGGPLKAFAGAINLVSGAFRFLTMCIKANPLGFLLWLLVLGIIYWDEIGLALTRFWRKLKDYFADSTWGKPFLAVMETLEEAWDHLSNLFGELTWDKVLRTMLFHCLYLLEGFVHKIGSLLDKVGLDMGKDLLAWRAADTVNSLLGPPEQAAAAAATPGAAARRAAERGLLSPTAQPVRPEFPSLKAAGVVQVPQGGLMTSFTNRVHNTGKALHIGEQHLHFENPPQSPPELFAMSLG